MLRQTYLSFLCSEFFRGKATGFIMAYKLPYDPGLWSHSPHSSHMGLLGAAQTCPNSPCLPGSPPRGPPTFAPITPPHGGFPWPPCLNLPTCSSFRIPYLLLLLHFFPSTHHFITNDMIYLSYLPSISSNELHEEGFWVCFVHCCIPSSWHSIFVEWNPSSQVIWFQHGGSFK